VELQAVEDDVERLSADVVEEEIHTVGRDPAKSP
jgi:hypothetical protein